MSKELESYTFRAGTRAKYPWDKWQDGKPHALYAASKPGKDQTDGDFTFELSEIEDPKTGETRMQTDDEARYHAARNLRTAAHLYTQNREGLSARVSIPPSDPVTGDRVSMGTVIVLQFTQAEETEEPKQTDAQRLAVDAARLVADVGRLQAAEQQDGDAPSDAALAAAGVKPSESPARRSNGGGNKNTTRTRAKAKS